MHPSPLALWLLHAGDLIGTPTPRHLVPVYQFPGTLQRTYLENLRICEIPTILVSLKAKVSLGIQTGLTPERTKQS